MRKREKIAFVKRIWKRLHDRLAEAYEAKNETEFDWYSDGLQAFWCALDGKPVTITPRVKPLR